MWSGHTGTCQRQFVSLVSLSGSRLAKHIQAISEVVAEGEVESTDRRETVGLKAAVKLLDSDACATRFVVGRVALLESRFCPRPSISVTGPSSVNSCGSLAEWCCHTLAELTCVLSATVTEVCLLDI